VTVIRLSACIVVQKVCRRALCSRGPAAQEDIQAGRKSHSQKTALDLGVGFNFCNCFVVLQ